MASLSPYVFMQEFDNNGNLLVGGKVLTYEAGTTTPKATYTDSTGTVANANPVVLDANGRAAIWLGDGGYKFVLTDADDVTIKTIDNVGGTSSTAFGAQVHNISTNTLITNVYANSTIIATGTTTLTLLEAAEAGEGFYFIVRNEGTGTVTIDPDGSETIDNTTTIEIASKGSALITTDGLEWYSFFNMTMVSPNFTGAIPPQYNSAYLATEEFVADELLELAQTRCELVKSGANLVLQRKNGTLLTINNNAETIPSAGVSLAPDGLSVGTNYYIYAYMNGATMTLEASATAPATSTVSGIQIKTGSETRTLVGAARIITGPAFVDSGQQRFVRSFYNEKAIVLLNEFTANRSTTSTSYAILHASEALVEVLTWANETLSCMASGWLTFGASDDYAVGYTAFFIDATGVRGENAVQTANNTSNRTYGLAAIGSSGLLTFGHHTIELKGKVSLGTGTWKGGTAPEGCALRVTVNKA